MLERLADFPIPCKACLSTEQALAEYADESILFGRPDMIAELLPKMPTVDWVQSSWAGVTPLIEAKGRDYILTGVKDAFGPQMAEGPVALAHRGAPGEVPEFRIDPPFP